MQLTNNKKPVSRIWKWLAGMLLVIIAILGGIYFYINIHWKPIITEKIKSTVKIASKGLYDVAYQDVSINIFTGNVGFSKLTLKPNYQVYEKLRAQMEAPKHIFELDLYGLLLNNIHPWNIYKNKELDIKSIVIEKPVVKMIYRDVKVKGDSLKDSQTLYQRISKTLKSIKIGSIVIDEADFNYIDRTQKTARQRGLKNLSIKITDILVDSAADKDKSRIYYTKDIFLSLKNHQFNTKNGLYTIRVGEVTSSIKDQYVRLKNLRVKPRYQELQFARKFKFQHDRYDMFFKDVIFNHVDVAKINFEEKIHAGALIINGASIKVFMSRELPPVTFDKGRNYPHMALRRLKIDTKVDTVLIRNTAISYSEYNPKSGRVGTVSFKNFKAQILNVTNDPASLKKNHWARAQISTMLMGKALLNVNLNLNLIAKDAAFNFNGVLGKMDMTDLNSLTRNMSLAEIQSGVIQKALFNVSGNLRTSTGELRLYYNNLKVNILKKDEETNKIEKKGFLSTLANALLVKNDNPDKDGKLRIGKTIATRDNSGSFFNLMWKSVFNGVKESVGVTLDDVDKVQVKESRKEKRKEERKQRREERRMKKANK
ncbi:hypothetical protein GS399_00465 [Pedobacter sp. HMF7647]|uniref:DUF748 domain-containing protein n=1 Tax=Hufsiella arboris TaxID=2695275 RepID=A0A7K1Y4C2_9SPHI|nr:hypothetical protein [Hufsiella arboris]MXV49427.1 hypothetical protein [Hufsiella arboris]